MILIEAIFVNNGYSPKEIPNTKFGSHFDGEKYYFFESEEQRKAFYDELIKNQPIQDEIVE
jgi:YHS domain-containing protein